MNLESARGGGNGRTRTGTDEHKRRYPGVGGKEAGLYNAKKIVSILKGTKPRDLDQVFEKTARISVNLRTAELIGYRLPVDIIRSADEIFTEIEGGPNE